MMLKSVLALSLIAVSLPAFAGDPKAGGQVFKKCMACHAVGEGAKNKVGPELNGLFGRPAGSVPDYDYSEANKNSGIVWTPEVFAAYIKDPRGYIKGTKMAFAGLKKDKEVEDITAYLAQFNADGTLKSN
jgi:cytochrome c